MLDVSTEAVLAACRAGIFPHASERDGEWRIPQVDARRVYPGLFPGLGGPQQLYTLREFAGLLGLSYDHVWRECKAWRIRTVGIVGTEDRRVPESEYWRLVQQREVRA